MLTYALALLAAAPVATPTATDAQAAQPPRELAAALASGDGASQQTAFKASSVAQEYAMLRYLRLNLVSQALVAGGHGKAYDRLTATDPRTGETREVWFDISSFFGKEFGL